jgi:radical SAM-linked protein
MHKVIVRADLPLWYTEGFNPKPKMIFAAPLSIGTESLVEFMDLRLTEMVDPQAVMDRLNRNMVQDMQIYDAYYPDSKFTDLKWLSYRMCLRLIGDQDKLSQEISSYLSKDRIEVTKKSGEDVVDIKPLMKSFEVTKKEGYIEIYTLLSADPSAFLNPEYVIKSLKEGLGILKEENLTSESYSIMREAAYLADMTEFR